MRALAFYLPQFHPIPENDGWWGAGFTEWTNVARAKPLFPGHVQPRCPSELGYYDLRVPETRAAQAELARDHGIEGFCYWHYWFAGRRLLERPFLEVLESGEPKFPFCLAWANQSWSGIWHGAPDRILMEQSYPGPEDDEAHFHCILEALGDERYVRVHGKPLFVVYSARSLPNPLRATDIWRELACRHGLGGLYLVALAQRHEIFDPRPLGFDALAVSNHSRVLESRRRGRRRKFDGTVEPRAVFFEREILRRVPNLFLYEDAMRYFLWDAATEFPCFPCVVPGWDSSPRSGPRALVLHDETPALFERHVRDAVKRVVANDPEERIFFIKSWNEWAEGNFLEPDERWGRAFLEVVKSVMETEQTA